MSWLQNTFRCLIFKNIAFNLTIQVLLDLLRTSRTCKETFQQNQIELSGSNQMMTARVSLSFHHLIKPP